MPRTRQGGQRGGTTGTPYPNRTDIGNQPNLPARVATGQTYGKAQSQLQAQQAVPMAPPRLALPTPGAGGGAIPPPGAPTAPGVQPPVQGPLPGSLGALHRPTERPAEPVTAGAPVGPGPGPEAIPQGPTSPQNTNLSRMLAQVAQSSGSAAVSQLAQRAQAAGQ